MSKKDRGLFGAGALSMLDGKQRTVLQGVIGVAVFVVFTLLTLQSVQALNQIAGYYGYYNGTYAYNNATTSSDALPSAPTSLSVSQAVTAATVSWTAPTTTTDATSLDNLEEYTIAYDTSSITDCTDGTSTDTDSTTASYSLTGLTANTTYYVAVCAKDDNKNRGLSLTGSFTTNASTTSSGGGGGGGGSTSSDDSSDDSDDSDDDSVAVEEGESDTSSYEVGTATPVTVGSASHTVTVSEATEESCTLTIESDPIEITVANGEYEDVDTDSDGIDDVRVQYDGLDDDGNPQLTITALEVSMECEMPSGTGTSPVSGDEEEITDVEAGDFIKSDSYSTVYQVTADCGRRVFMDEKTYFTWQDDFDSLVTVTDATLAELSLEGVMLPKAGVVLVKIQSDPKVYALGDGSTYTPDLQWVTSEDVAIELFGDDWADYVIDVEPTFFTKFGDGDDIEDADDFDADTDKMKKRDDLSG